MPQLYRVLYQSKNCVELPAEKLRGEIDRILATSRQNNRRDGITGALLFSEGWFAQVLEGPADTLESTFERIQCDERHQKVTVLQSGVIDAREFPEWSMAFTSTLAASPAGEASLGVALRAQSSAGDRLVHLLKEMVSCGEDGMMPR